MNTLNNAKFFGWRLKISAFAKKILSFFLSVLILFVPLTFTTFALESTDGNRVTVTVNNPLAAFPDAYYKWFDREASVSTGDTGWTSFYSYEKNLIDNTSARFVGEFQAQDSFDSYAQRDGVYKVILKGQPPVSRLYAGDSIRLRCTIQMNWAVSTTEITNNYEVWNPSIQFGFLPAMIRSYFACFDVTNNETITLPIYHTGTDIVNQNGEFDSVITTWGTDIQDVVRANPSSYPSIGLDNAQGFGYYFPYKLTVRPYVTYVTCDFTIPIPSDVTFSEQPLNIVFDCGFGSDGTKYEHLNFISFEFHNFNYQITSNIGNLQLSELADINQNLNDIFNQYGDPLIPQIKPNQTITSVEEFEDEYLGMASDALNGFAPQFQSALNLINSNTPVIGSIQAMSKFIDNIIGRTPLGTFFIIALPISIFAIILSIGATYYTRHRDDVARSNASAYRNSYAYYKSNRDRSSEYAKRYRWENRKGRY